MLFLQADGSFGIFLLNCLLCGLKFRVINQLFK